MAKRVTRTKRLSQERGRTRKRPGEGVTLKRQASPAALLKQVSAICLAFAGAEREDHPGTNHATFRVRKKVFAYFLADHHGDGIISVCFKGAPGEQAEWMTLDAKRYYSPDYIGPRGWIGLRLDQGKINWGQVEKHVTASYLSTAPKRLAKQRAT